MAVSYLFRSTFERKWPKRSRRRWNVILFVTALIVALIEGGTTLRAHTVLARAVPYVALLPILLYDTGTKRRGNVYVTSLDDRAVFKYGAEYDALTPEQQKDILDHYRVGTYAFPRPPEQSGPGLSNRHYVQRAVTVYRWCAVPLFLVYAAGWRWLPQGLARDAWTNLPVVLAVSFATAFALPILLKLWNDPD